ncbi:hypothetical protein DZK27_13120 [Rhodobacteraceae bacterium 63075]|nr:hypothetical protein DZK27_13120 [Rhodobacteraceae bacterium 63075]
MDHDLFLTIGLIVAVFSVPSVISAISDGRTPRVAAIVLVVSGGLVAYAVTQKPGGYSMDQVPNVIVNVIARFTG